jgi:hypothetical protein
MDWSCARSPPGIASKAIAMTRGRVLFMRVAALFEHELRVCVFAFSPPGETVKQPSAAEASAAAARSRMVCEDRDLTASS